MSIIPNYRWSEEDHKFKAMLSYTVNEASLGLLSLFPTKPKPNYHPLTGKKCKEQVSGGSRTP